MSHWSMPLSPPRFRDGHRLPLRLEIQPTDVGPIAVVVDEDHRDVEIPNASFDDLLAYVAAANEGLPHTVGHRLVSWSPCDAMSWHLATAFECLAVGVYRHWITPAIREELKTRICWTDRDGHPHPVHVDRWLRWRKAEDEALVAKGLRAVPAPPFKAVSKAFRGYLGPSGNQIR